MLEPAHQLGIDCAPAESTDPAEALRSLLESVGATHAERRRKDVTWISSELHRYHWRPPGSVHWSSINLVGARLDPLIIDIDLISARLDPQAMTTAASEKTVMVVDNILIYEEKSSLTLSTSCDCPGRRAGYKRGMEILDQMGISDGNERVERSGKEGGGAW
uniref:Uncharacterized protein n=1 Tax=Oryza brachyantha TaxID=4533 RepID=J3M360_ORYBR